MERAPGDLERDLDLDFGRRKTPDLLRRLLDEPWCFDEWWDLRLITEAESQPSKKPMVNFGKERDECGAAILYYTVEVSRRWPLSLTFVSI